MEGLPSQGGGLFRPVITLLEQRQDECDKLRIGPTALYRL
jgi:hypothetical protein